LAALHLYWGRGGLWPEENETALARTVVGARGIREMPGDTACYTVAFVLFLAGCWPLSAFLGLPPSPLPSELEHRTKAIGIMQSGWSLGYIAAILLSSLVLDVLSLGPEAWRWLFALGALPALLTLWIRRSVEEPAAWKRKQATAASSPNAFAVLFSPKYRRKTILATLLTACVQFANWGLFFWLPGFLATPVERGGAGMTLVRSAAWLIPTQLGAYVGYLSFGFIADRFGRRRTFIAYMVIAAILVPLYGQMARNPTVLLLLGPVLGFVGYGYFSMFGSFLAELFPVSARATGQGLTYNTGRGLGALAPYTIGFLATLPRVGIGSALAVTSAFFLAAALLILFFPDTSGQQLED
jgi:MFS family permease